MKSLDDEIGRQLARAVAAGQLRASAGKPLEVDEAWLQTPPALRMTFQIMKSAGMLPAEVQLLRWRATLRESLANAEDEETRERLTRQLAELEQNLALRLEARHNLGRE